MLGYIDSFFPTFVGNSDGGPFFFLFRKHTCPEKEVRKKKIFLSLLTMFFLPVFSFSVGAPERRRPHSTADETEKEDGDFGLSSPLLFWPTFMHNKTHSSLLVPRLVVYYSSTYTPRM